VDCLISCPPGAGVIDLPKKETIDDWQIAFTFGMYFIMGCVFIVGSILIITLAVYAHIQELKQEKGN
jgi:hypothetical protein